MKKGVDVKLLKGKILEIFDVRNVEYLVEYNVGYEYFVKDVFKNFYWELDFINSFNLGIGKIIKCKNWVE